MDTVAKTVGQRYAAVNGAWPSMIPTLTEKEAITATRRLYRKFMGKVFLGGVRVTSGNRYTWARGGQYGEFTINPTKGWRELVHDLSHYVHSYRYRQPGQGGHDFRHEFLEGEMVKYVIEHGWLDGKLRRPVKTKPPIREVRKQRIEARLAAWKKKAKRAATAIKKLERQQRYYS